MAVPSPMPVSEILGDPHSLLYKIVCWSFGLSPCVVCQFATPIYIYIYIYIYKYIMCNFPYDLVELNFNECFMELERYLVPNIQAISLKKYKSLLHGCNLIRWSLQLMLLGSRKVKYCFC